jgi:hypothetical protein
MDFLREFGADLANLANVQADSSQVRQNNSEKVGDDKRRRNSKNMIEARKLDYSLAFRVSLSYHQLYLIFDMH